MDVFHARAPLTDRINSGLWHIKHSKMVFVFTSCSSCCPRVKHRIIQYLCDILVNLPHLLSLPLRFNVLFEHALRLCLLHRDIASLEQDGVADIVPRLLKHLCLDVLHDSVRHPLLVVFVVVLLLHGANK